jgi:large subunit ribosomal protein L4
VFKNLEVTGTAVLVLPEHQEALFKSTRNLDRAAVRTAADLNAYDVVRHERVIFTREGFDKLVERVGHGGN